MKRVPVTSSRVISIGWENNIMEVEFTGGAIYRYFDIHKDVYDDIMASESQGKALSVIINDKTIKYEKVTPESL